jgi:hypothetical protein
MNGHGEQVSFLSIKASPGEKSLNVGADLVRQIFGDFEFHFRVGGIHLNNSG